MDDKHHEINEKLINAQEMMSNQQTIKCIRFWNSFKTIYEPNSYFNQNSGFLELTHSNEKDAFVLQYLKGIWVDQMNEQVIKEKKITTTTRLQTSIVLNFEFESNPYIVESKITKKNNFCSLGIDKRCCNGKVCCSPVTFKNDFDPHIVNDEHMTSFFDFFVDSENDDVNEDIFENASILIFDVLRNCVGYFKCEFSEYGADDVEVINEDLDNPIE
ncbi:Nucleosome assembly protein [Entamoeba marina]